MAYPCNFGLPLNPKMYHHIMGGKPKMDIYDHWQFDRLSPSYSCAPRVIPNLHHTQAQHPQTQSPTDANTLCTDDGIQKAMDDMLALWAPRNQQEPDYAK